MRKLQAVVLDYPRDQIEDPDVKTIMGDLIQNKQINFASTDKNYIPMSGLDMVSTHFLIYDMSQFLRPKLIFAIRACYEDRVYRHNLNLPIDQYSKWLPHEYKSYFLNFRETKGPLVDVNAWFVDPSWSFKKTGLNLSEFGFYAVVSHILKRGYDHFVGTANEKYKASRWVKNVGDFKDGMLYVHQLVPDPHLLILIEKFNYHWLLEKTEEFGDFYNERVVFSAKSGPDNKKDKTDKEVIDYIKSRALGENQAFKLKLIS